MTTTYEVTVGNIGTVYRGSNKETAIQDYNHYVELSKLPHGRGTGEQVTLFENSYTLHNYLPEL